MTSGRVGILVGVTGVASAVAVLGVVLAARAQPLAIIDDQSFDVSAERVDIDAELGHAVLQGAVTAKLGEVELRCDRVELRYDRAPQVSFARGTGSVSARLKGIEATASAVEFDAKARSVSLMGSVRLARGKGWVTAERATWDLATGKATLQDVKGSIPVQAAGR